MVIENKGGAGGNIAFEMVARSDPDGYTVLIDRHHLVINRFLYASVGFDAEADFAPVSLICQYPNLMVVPNSSPASRSWSLSPTLRPIAARSPSPRPAPGPRPICPGSCSSAWPASR